MNACPAWEAQISGYLDKELTEAEAREVETHLETCPACRRELEKQKQLLEVTDTMKFLKPPEEVWERYWDHIYNRLERQIGWIFLSIGAIVLAAWGLYALVTTVLPDFWNDPSLHIAVKIGIIAAGLGVAVLFVSVLRERILTIKTDRYREVKR
ncbi:anti-sigma factor family protein [candidate division KSB1 bacterium]